MKQFCPITEREAARRAALPRHATKHGLHKTSEYVAWASMLQRCKNPKSSAFHYYGARGITVSERWNKFENFFADMGPKPTPQHTLERLDNNGNYCGSNCAWRTWPEQNRNNRGVRLVTINGVTKCLKDWCTELDQVYHLVIARITRKWDVITALTTPRKTKYCTRAYRKNKQP